MSGCEDCQDFIALTERWFGPTLGRFGFRLAGCRNAEAKHGRRECELLYESACGTLFFAEDDGATYCMVAAPGATVPGAGWVGERTGEAGWYDLEFLISYLERTRLPGRRLTQAFLNGRRVHFEWLADQLARHADEVFDLLASHPSLWRERFERFNRNQLQRTLWQERWLPFR